MKQNGLERSRWIEPIEDFVRQHGRETPRWAAFLTYQFDPARFSRSVMPALSRKGRCFRTMVLADQGALEKSLVDSRPQLTGALNLHPVHCHGRGVFHPKLVFLRAGRHIRACFGSANLTAGGLGSNLELWSFTESPEALRGIIYFLETLVQSRAIALDDGARRSLRHVLAGLVGAETDLVWSSLHGTFADRISAGPESKASEVKVISPMFSGHGSVRDARSAIRCGNFKLYTHEPASVPNCQGMFLYSPPCSAAADEEDTEALPTELHAQAYLEWNPAKMEQREGRGDRVGRKLRDKLSILYCLVPRTYDERMFHQLVARERWHGVLLGKPAAKLADDQVDAPAIDPTRIRRMRLDLRPA